MGFTFTVEPSDLDEEWYKNAIPADPRRLALTLAEEKAKMVGARHRQGLIIGADTLITVTINEQTIILGKADDEKEAEKILTLLSGRTHQVLTGVAIFNATTRQLVSDLASTDVTFKALSSHEIQNYIAANEWRGKAGAYAIQGSAATTLIANMGEDESNVRGLPLSLLTQLLSR